MLFRSRFSVVAITNLIINPTLMMWYYDVFYGKSYAFMTIPRVMKNLALFPAEAFLLTLFLGVMVPIVIKLGFSPNTNVKPILSKRHILMLVAFFIIAAMIVVGYYSLFIPTQPASRSVTENGYKLTLKSERGTYQLSNADPEAPLSFTATLKNENKTDANADYVCDIELVPTEDAINIPNLSVYSDSAVIEAGKSVKHTDTFAAELSEMNGLPKGKYTAVATVNMTVDGEEITLTVELPIRIK